MEYNYNYFDSENKELHEALDKITLAKKYYMDQREEAEKALKIRDLLYADLVRAVKANKTDWEYVDLKAAFQQRDATAKKERETLNFVIDKVLRAFVSEEQLKQNEFTFSGITCLGIEGYAYTLSYKVKNIGEYSFFPEREIFVTIPRLAALTVSNFDYAHEGKFECGYKSSENYLNVIKLSYDPEEIKAALSEWLVPKIIAV